MCSAKTIVFVHGLSPKPSADALLKLWQDALLVGLKRDYPQLVEQCLSVPAHLVYYSDLLPPQAATSYDAELDLADRQRTLELLTQLDKPKRFRRSYYEAVPGKTALKEFVADVGTPLMRGIGLGQFALNKLLPHSEHYWSRLADCRVAIQDRVLQVLAPALQAQQDVLLISHGFGAVVSYDTLWRLSHEIDLAGAARLRTWLTLGSPLADDTVRKRLLGSNESGTRRYPANLINWHNVAAEDDFVCHDETVVNDFAPLLANQQISVMQDHLIYNLSVRYGGSNPHSSLGYLAHPKLASLVAQWLNSASPSNA